MDQSILWMRTKRLARRSLWFAYSEYHSTLFRSDRLFDAALAILVSYIGLQTATLPQVIEEADAWANFIQALFYVTIAWAVFCIVRGPFLAAADDRARGFWVGNRFVYREPHLVATFRCKPTGQVERYSFKFNDVEPGSYVSFEIRLEGAANLAEIGLGGLVVPGVLPFQNWPGTGGLSLPKNRQAIFQIRLPTNAVATTARIYCRNFTVGPLNDQDGDAGNFQFPRPPQ